MGEGGGVKYWKASSLEGLEFQNVDGLKCWEGEGDANVILVTHTVLDRK